MCFARTGDNNSMGRNLRAARWLDFTDKDDDDGLYQPCSDSDSEATKKKGEADDQENNNNNTNNSNNNNNNNNNNKARTHKRTGSGGGVGSSSGGLLTAAAAAAGAAVGASVSSVSAPKRTSVSVKRPLDIVLPCQEIQYLDICYQKVQYSPIPRKKIAYQHVPYISIPYCEVPYWSTSERPIKRKPLQRSHSIAVADLREPEDCEWSSYKLR